MDLLELVTVGENFIDELEVVIEVDTTSVPASCVLPEIDGWSSAEILKKTFEVPVIFMTRDPFNMRL